MSDTLDLRVSGRRRFQMVAGGFILGTIMGAVLGYGVLQMVLRQAMSETLERLPLFAIGGAALGLVSALWQSSYRAVVTRDTLEIHRGGRLWQSFPRSSTAFSSKVTTTRTNGIRSGVQRELTVENAAGQATYTMPGFGKREFSLLINALNPISGEEGLISPHMRDQPVPTITYPVDAATIRKPLTTMRVVFVILFASTAIIVGFFAWLATDGDLRLTLIATAIGAAVILPALLVAWVSTSKKMSRVPSGFMVGSSGIAADSRHFAPSSITRIELPPPGYVAGEAWLSVTSGNETSRYFLGQAAKLHDVFADYEAFIKHLAHATMHRPGLVHFDIG